MAWGKTPDKRDKLSILVKLNVMLAKLTGTFLRKALGKT